MSDAPYERYKDALQRGHIAAAKGRQAAALEAYGEAAKIAPDRALPLIGIGTVLCRLDKQAEALAAFDAALDRAPADETALAGRADAATALGRRADAAESLDRLAASYEAKERLADAADAATRALELAESRGRRQYVAILVERLGRADQADPAVAAATERATALLAATGGADTASGVPAVAPPPFDPIKATAELDQAVGSGDADLTRAVALDAAAGHRAAGHRNAAIDACYQAMASVPADPGLHLALAELYLDRGWRSLAADKLVLLARLAELTQDATTRSRVCAVARERVADDARLAGICA